jgi:putative DNA primase/helicase
MKTTTLMPVATAPKRNSAHWRQGEVTWGDLVSWMDTPGTTKEAGNYFLGTLRETTVVHKKGGDPCTGMHRINPAVVSRSAITLDADTPRADLPDVVELLLGCAAIVHTTYSSSPDDPRFRIIIPIDRPLLPDEYFAAVSALMQQLGEDQFDKGSVEPARYMFKPAAQEPSWFQHWVIDGPALAVDPLLAGWDPDLSKLSTPKPHRNKRDPYELEGVVGAFNLLITSYELPYDSAEDGRWSLHGTASVAGMGEMGPGLVYSHHITDPAYGQACSAFDLVRLHMWGHLDKDEALDKPVNRRPSHAAMLETAAGDPRVQAERVGLDFAEDLDDDLAGTFDDAAVWKLELKFENKTDTLLDTIRNWDIVTANDPAFTGLHFNEFTLAVEIDTDLPWRTVAAAGTMFDTADLADLALYLERTYGVQLTDRRINQLVITTAARTRVNPVRDYLDALTWDGKHRVEKCLPGVRPTSYTMMVARKCLAAAVARVYEPGIKWDHTLILYGPEGLGKTFWVESMARGYSASLGPINQKDTLLTMQRNWIMLADEGYSLRKADADLQKEFLTKRVDVFRAPYDARPTAYPRHSVIWGSTNDEVFLRRQEGNRRFLIVRCEDKVDFAALTPAYIDQVWAEAVHIYRSGELLYLDDDQSLTAAAEREGFIEEDALEGVIQEFLDTPVPSEWATMSSEARLGWRQSYLDGLVGPGDSTIDQTCSAELYVEALGRRFGDHRRSELLDINTALKRVPGWVARPGRHRVRQYGPQQVFVRLDQNDIDEVI